MPVSGRARRDDRSAPVGLRCGRSLPSSAKRHRRSRASVGASTPMWSSSRWSLSYFVSCAVPGRSSAISKKFAEDPSMWLCHENVYQAVYQPNSCFLRPKRWLRIVAHRYELVATTVARTSIGSGAGRDFSSRRSAFMIAVPAN